MRGKKRSRDGDGNGFEAWGGYMNAKIQKLEEQFSKTASHMGESERLSNIFNDVAIFVNGYTQPSSDELRVLMLLHGGTYHHYHRSAKTTHVIATNLPNAKMNQLKTMKVVHPRWITESITAGKLLNYKDFVLFTNPSALEAGFMAAQNKLKSSYNAELTEETGGTSSAGAARTTVDAAETSSADAIRTTADATRTAVDAAGTSSADAIRTTVDAAGTSSKGGAKTAVDAAGTSSADAIRTTVDAAGTSSKGAAKTAVDAEFLSEFYNKSRLHHLSTMGAMFKQYVGKLREQHSGTYPGRARLVQWLKSTPLDCNEDKWKRVIMHIDMDCFFVSVALRNHPELVGLPVAVTHAKGNLSHSRPGVDRKFEYEFYKKRLENRLGEDTDQSESEDEAGDKPVRHWTDGGDSCSEIASCSYEARQAGVRNGMYLGTAFKLCPNLKTVAYDFEGYKEVSFCLYNIVAEYTLDMEAVSCDELFVDCTGLLRDTKAKPLEFVTLLRQEIREKTRCPSSAGLGSNKLQARLATKRAKPDGQFFLTESQVSEFMAEVDVNDLPGVGRTLSHKLKALRVQTCGDLQNLSLEWLKKEVGGKTGETLFNFCRGLDNRPVTSTHQRKSVSAEVNYGIRFSSHQETVTFFDQLSTEVSKRLQEVKMRGRMLTLKLMVRAKNAPKETAKFLGHGACDTINKSTPVRLTDDASIISRHVRQLYQQLDVPPTELRGIGIQMTRLEGCSKVAPSLQAFLKTKTAPSIPTKQNENTDRLQLPPASQLDTEVIKSLPEDLRLEIMNEYGIENLKVAEDSKTNPTTSIAYSQINHEVLDQLPSDVKEELQQGLTRRRKSRQCGVWDGLELNEVRTMIREWVMAEETPQQCDVDMLTEHVRNLVEDRKSDHVAILLRCLGRQVQELRGEGRDWNSSYASVLDGVQQTMIQVYGGVLKL